MRIDRSTQSNFGYKIKGGIRFHLISGLTVFVLLILAIIWIFQVLLLDFFYERTKINQLDDVLSSIEKYVGSDDIDSICGELASQYDVCISIYDVENETLGDRIVNKEVSPTCVIHYVDLKTMEAYFAEAVKSGREVRHRYAFTPGAPIKKVDDKRGDKFSSDIPSQNDFETRELVVAVSVKSIADSYGNQYAVFVNLEFTPISTVQQTRNVQFGYITVLILVLTVAFSWAFSANISRSFSLKITHLPVCPLTTISKSLFFK